MLNKRFMSRIENPNNEKNKELLEKALEKRIYKDGNDKKNLQEFLTAQLGEEKIGGNPPRNRLVKFAYTFYYDWEENEDPDYVFLVQNPGKLKKRHIRGEVNDEVNDEVDKILNACKRKRPYHRCVNIYRSYIDDWLLGENGWFGKGFFKLLTKKRFLDKNTYEEFMEKTGDKDNLSEVFFQDFYLTDLVKYRVTGKISREEREASYEEFLKEELREIEPELVFCFGSIAWKTLVDKKRIKPDHLVQSDYTGLGNQEVDPEELEKITKVHGCLFKTNDYHVIPLVHFSGKNASFLRRSYFDYLEEGLDAYNAKD